MVTRLAGVMCALVTPFDEDGEVDLDGLQRLTERVVRGRVTGICPVGSTGEGSRLTGRQRRAVVERVRALIPREVALIPSPSTLVAGQVIEDVEAFADLGADAVLVAPPPGYLLDGGDVRRFYEKLATRSPLPIVLYNFPTLNRVGIPAAVAGELAHHDSVIGIKDSSRDLEYTQALLGASASAPDFVVLTGSDTLLLPTLTIGGSGAIVGSANMVPDLGVAVYEATLAGDWPTARLLQWRLFEVVTAARAAGFPYGWKAALEMAGICSAYPAPPASAVSGETLAALRRRLTELQVL
jgi:4-hydroxy-tetrahydrodipicolinate synthase